MPTQNQRPEKKCRTIIWAGDMNVDLDKSKDSLQVKNLIKEYSLLDAYRKVNKIEPGHTWGNSRGAKSRLDYVFIPSCLKVKTACVKPVFYSDHAMLVVSCHINSQQYGKSYWKFNNTLLRCNIFNKDFRDFFKDCVELQCFYPRKTEWWDNTKNKIKTFTQEFCKKRNN